VPNDEWSIDIDKWVDDAIQLNQSVQKDAVVSLFSDIIHSSPVDDGRFRSNWFLSGSSPSSEVGGITSLSSKLADINSGMAILDDEFTLTNNLPYSEVIEYGGYTYNPDSGNTTPSGFSKQAPQGVVRVNAARWSKLVNEAARERK